MKLFKLAQLIIEYLLQGQGVCVRCREVWISAQKSRNVEYLVGCRNSLEAEVKAAKEEASECVAKLEKKVPRLLVCL